MMACPDCSWQLGSHIPNLSSEDIHVWFAPLNLPTSDIDALRSFLSLDELEKAARFRSANAQNHFVVARGLLRSLLGSYINILPQRLCFCYGLYGKPALDECYGQYEIQFNLSHSRDFVIFSITLNARVGIDLEYVYPFPEIGQLAGRFFGPHKRAVFQAQSSDDWMVTFFRYWTKKEAYAKAKGQGLPSVSDHFTVNANLARSTSLINMDDDAEDDLGWSFYNLMPIPNYIATIAIEGGNWEISCWQWMKSESVSIQHAS